MASSSGIRAFKNAKQLLPSLFLAATFGIACQKHKPDSENSASGSATAHANSSMPGNVRAEDLKFINDTEEKERNALKAQVLQLAFKSEFDQLETLASEFRENKPRFRNGIWKLRCFYIAF